jgi:DNA-binding SARP family transcriptional activator/tetratricopeptide (TPR) repeat protein
VTELQLLGPVQMRVARRAVDLGPAKQRTVLAALLVDADQPMSTETLIDRIWGDDPPVSVRSTLYSYVARLRRVLLNAVDGLAPPLLLEHVPGGYRMILTEQDVDLYRFRRLVGLARDCDHHDDEHRAAMLDEARGLWHGPALADLPGEWASRTREALSQQRLDAMVLWARIQLRLGRTDELIGPLREVLGEHPHVEPLAATLMEALLREGRSAEALDCYGTTRRRLVDDLGVEPGPELRRLHVAILRHDGDGRRGRAAANGPRQPQPSRTVPKGDATRPLAVPVQLPLDVYGFTGRGGEIARLDSLLAAAATQPNAVVVFALCGGAGVGKTALAVHWAHRVADQFPGGQLFVNLRGFDPAGAPMTVAEAVRLLLDALGVPSERVPVSEGAQVGLYRSMLAGRRVLVVLDNAATAEQVRPLLPGSPGCLAVVTSRDRLSGLGTAEAAHPLTLDVMDAAEAGDLLAARIGVTRVAAEPTAAKEIVDRCARLPLALAVAAARAAAQPHLPLVSLAAELAEDQLEAFADTDPAADLRTVFSWSFRSLSPAAARLFRLLGLHPGPDIDTAAAASLTAVPPPQARRHLAELARAHLVTEHVAGRFAFHDLLRAYAGELALAHDSTRGRRAALNRVLDHYVHGAHAAARTMTPHADPVDLVPPAAGVVVATDLGDPAQALAWITARRAVLVTNLRLAARSGFHAHTWQLAWALGPALDRSGHWRELADVHELALAAACRLTDRRGQAYAHRMLGRALGRLGDLDTARVHYEHALSLCAGIGDQLGRAHTHLSLGWLGEQRGEYRGALGHVRRAEALYAAAGHLAGQGSALNQAGWYHAQLGEYEEALVDCERALVLQLEAGHRVGQASTWDSLGFANHHLGRHRQAANCYGRALELHRDNGDRYREAATLARSADCHDAAGDADSAGREWTAALAIFESLNHPDAVDVSAKLVSMGTR